MKIGHGFLSGLLPKFSDYDALLHIFVLSNYCSSNKSKKTFETGKNKYANKQCACFVSECALLSYLLILLLL